MKRKAILHFFFCLWGLSLVAQNSESLPAAAQAQHQLTLHPAHVFFRAVKLDYANKRSTHSWLAVSPSFYYSSSKYLDVENYLGGELGLSYKWYAYPIGESNVYLASVFNYGYFVPQKKEFSYISQVINDTEYFVYREHQVKMPVHRWQFGFTCGKDIYIDHLLFGFYGSLVFQYSSFASTKQIEPEKLNLLDFGYTGINVNFGLRIGGIF